MKKLATLFLVFVVIFSFVPSFSQAANAISITINGYPVYSYDAPPYIDHNSRTMVPLRFISENLGYSVKYDSKTKEIAIGNKGKEIKLKAGSKTMSRSGVSETMDTPTVIRNNRSFVPIRFVTTALETKLAYDNLSKRVMITDPSIQMPSPPQEEGFKVRGVYLSGYSASSDLKFHEVVNLVDRTSLNSVVLDAKGDEGYMMYNSSVSLVNAYGSDSRLIIKDIRQRMKVLKDKNIYTIARIVTFKDPYLANRKKEFAMKKYDGSLYLDNGVAWIDPYKQEYWKYVLDIAKEAASLGFDEIQFDYVRFPTNGKYVDTIVKFDNPYKKTKAQNIRDFLLYAKKELKSYNVKISADIFGIATSDRTDSGIGHHWETLTQAVDVMSPMMYPSHYGSGMYGISIPDRYPYLTIKRGLTPAVERDNLLRSQGKNVAKIRPWFQDFTDTRVSGYLVYGPKEVNDQIRAAHELGIDEFLLWNPRNIYSEGAFR